LREPEEEETLVQRHDEKAQEENLRDIPAGDALPLGTQEMEEKERDRGAGEAQQRGRERADRVQRALPDDMRARREDLIQNERENDP